MKPFGISELNRFITCHSRIFIFGHGKYGKGLEEYFEEKGWTISGFIVSNPNPDVESEKALCLGSYNFIFYFFQTIH